MASVADASSSGNHPATGDNALQNIIASYLKKKGYQRSLEGLAADLSTSVDKIAVSLDLMNDATILQAITNYNPSEKFPGSFEQTFHALSMWVEKSLDQCKPELSSILYPLYVHGYLDLIKKGQQLYGTPYSALPRSHTLLRAERALEAHCHLDEVEDEHRDEINRIMAIQTAEHLQENELAQLWLSNRYKISMSSFSYDLLMTFLQEQNYLLLRSMVNEHLAISTFAGFPGPSSESVTMLDKPSQEIMDAKEPKEVRWGVYKELRKWYELDEEDEEKATGDSEAAPETEEDAATKKRKRETSARRKAAREKADAKAPETKVPVQSELGPDAEKELLNDLRARANLSSEALPSIAFYTIFNTHNNMTCSAISRDAGLMATGFGDSSVRLWDVEADYSNRSKWQAAQQNYIDMDGRVPKYHTQPGVFSQLIGHSQTVTSLDFAPDSSYLLSSSADGTVRLWSNETKTNVVCYRGHNFPVWQTKFAPMGYYFATASHDRTARLWVTSNVHAMRIFAGHGNDVNCVSFHPNYYYLMTGSTDKTLRLWEVQTGDCVRIFAGHGAAVYDAQVCPDGRFAVSAGEDANVNIWDLGAGKRCGSLKGHTGPIWSLDISGDGTTVASGSSDNSVRLWDLRVLSDYDSTANPLTSSAGASDARWDKASLGTYSTKSTPVFKVSFTKRNLLTAAGPFRPPPETS